MNVKFGCGEISWLKQLMLKVRNTHTHTWLKISIRCSTGQKPVSSVQFSCSVMFDSLWPNGCSTPGLPVHHQPQEFAQTHVHWGSDAIQQTHPLSSPSPPTFSLSQHQSLFKWVCPSHQVAKVLEFQLQHQSFQWTLRTDLL